MMNDELALKAKTNAQAANLVYANFFGGNRIDHWLMRKGITSESERNDLKELLNFELGNYMVKWVSKNGTTFEHYVWQNFNFCIISFFQNKAKRIFEPVDNHAQNLSFFIGDISENNLDLDTISESLHGKMKKIFDLLRKGHERKDMPEFEISLKSYDQTLPRIKKFVQTRYSDQVVV